MSQLFVVVGKDEADASRCWRSPRTSNGVSLAEAEDACNIANIMADFYSNDNTAYYVVMPLSQAEAEGISIPR